MFQKLDREGKPRDAAFQLSEPRPVKMISQSLALMADRHGYIAARAEVVPPLNTEIVLTRVGW
jgi:hypothetical protein